MRKTIAALLAVVVSLAIPLSASALATKGLNWYPHRIEGNPVPGVMPEAKNFFDRYNAVYMGDPSKQIVYLTFDAGYDNGNMPLILDALKAEGVRAAFFLDGNFVKRNPELVKRIAAEGHLVCNHTLNHPDMTKYATLQQYSAQLTGWEELVRALDVEPAKYLRPPSGIFSEQTLDFDRQLGYKTVFWSASYLDWDVNKQMAPAAALPKIMERVHNGAILLLHSVSATNAKILPQFIAELRAKGYSFGTLDEL